MPFIVAWPDVIRQGKTDFMCSFWDMLPTFAQLTGVKIKNHIDGISLMPLLTGKGNKKSRIIFILNSTKGEDVRHYVKGTGN